MSFLSQQEMPDSFGPFIAFRENFGFVPNLFQAQTLLPRVIEAEAQIAGAVLLKPSALSRTQKECILLAVAASKQNTYCLTAHTHILQTLGMNADLLDRIAGHYPSSELPRTDKALLDFAVKLSQTPTLISGADINNLRSIGFSDEQVLEAVLMSALTNFLCTLSVGLDAEPDFEPWKHTQSTASVETRDPVTAQGIPNRQTHQKSGPYLRAEEKSPETFGPFAFFQDKFGFVPNIFRAQTLRPDVLEAEANAVGTVLLTEDVLSRFQKESILLVISASNLNTYCVAVHCEMLRAMGISPENSDQIAVDHHYADLSDSDKALLDFVLKLTERPTEFSIEDIDDLRGHDFSEEQILESVVMTALTSFLNTLQMGLGTVRDFEPRLIFPLQEVNLSPAPARPILERLLQGALRDDPDSKIVARVQAGETEAFEELVRRHGRRVYRSLVGILGSADEAEDALQDAFLKAFQHIRNFEGRSTFSTWLVRIAINTGVQRLRGRKDLETLDEDSDEGFRPRQIQAWQDDPEQKYSKTEMRRLVEDAIRGLPSKYRLVIMLRDMEELSTEDAAEALGLGMPALKARLLRGRLMLREVLSPSFTKQKGGTTHA